MCVLDLAEPEWRETSPQEVASVGEESEEFRRMLVEIHQETGCLKEVLQTGELQEQEN